MLVYQASGFIRLILVASVISVDQMGLYAVAGSLTAAAAILGDSGLRQLYLSRRADGVVPDPDKLLDTTWSGILGARLAIAFLTVPLAWVVPFFIAVERHTLIAMATALAISQVISALSNPTLLKYERGGNFVPSVKLDALGQILALGVVVLLFRRWPSVWLLVAGQLIAASTVLVLSYATLELRKRMVFDKGALVALLRMGRPFITLSVTTYITYNFDKLLIGAMLSPAASGTYFLAQRIAEAPAQLHTATFGRTTLPLYAARHEAGGLDSAKVAVRHYLIVTFLIFAAGALAATAIALVAPRWINEPKWLGVAALLPIMLAGVGVRAACHVISPILVVADRVHLDARFKIIESAIYIVLLPLAILAAGLTGAALAFFAIYALSLFNRYSAMHRLGDFRLGGCVGEKDAES
jgi:PST family polysaccharide transporter